MDSLRRRFDAVVFDLDGTLVDSAPDLALALNRLLNELGRPALALSAVMGMIGDGAAKLVERGFAATGGPPGDSHAPEPLRRFREIYLTCLAIETKPYPGTVETLSALTEAGLTLGICTNKPTMATEALLEALDLRRWFAAVTGGDGPERKPDPGPLLKLVDRMGAAPGRTVMVGDSPNDVAAARAAGLPAVLVSYGYTQVPVATLGADRIVDALLELPALLAAWPMASD